MKKITSLQVLMLMSLAVGSMRLHASSVVENELQAAFDQQAELNVLQDLAQSNPEVIEQIVREEAKAQIKHENLHQIKRFIDQINKEIENLSQQKNVAEIEIARLAVELNDAKIAFEKALAERKATHKAARSNKSNRLEQAISDNIMMAGQGLKRLQDHAGNGFNKAKKAVRNHMKRSRS